MTAIVCLTVMMTEFLYQIYLSCDTINISDLMYLTIYTYYYVDMS